MSTNDKRKSRKPWPADCIWPEPLQDGYGMQWEADLVDESTLDEYGQDLMEIKEYFDSLVETGRLNEDYSLNVYYKESSAALTDQDEENAPAETTVFTGLISQNEEKALTETTVFTGLINQGEKQEPVELSVLSGVNDLDGNEDEAPVPAPAPASVSLIDLGGDEEPAEAPAPVPAPAPASLTDLGGEKEPAEAPTSAPVSMIDLGEIEVPVYAGLADSTHYEEPVSANLFGLGKNEEPVFPNLFNLGEDESPASSGLSDLGEDAEPVFANLFGLDEDEEPVFAGLTDLGKTEEPVSAGLTDQGEDEEPVFANLFALGEDEEPASAGLSDPDEAEAVAVDLTDLPDQGKDEETIAVGLDNLSDLGKDEESISVGLTSLTDFGKDEETQIAVLTASDDEEGSIFVPEIGEDYWDNGFLIDAWEEDLSDHMNRLKIDMSGTDVIMEICHIIGYEFINENLLRQAFTRRDFAVEYGLSGCNEELEFLGDSVLNIVVTREVVKHTARNNTFITEGPFDTKYNEGDFTRIRSGFISKEYLAGRAAVLGLDKFILYGTNEEPGESSREDTMEALIGAVAIDSDWNWDAIETVIDRLLNMQLGDPDIYLKKTYYEIFNAWHQRQFGQIPSYEVHPALHESFDCTLRFSVPENDKGIRTAQRVDVNERTRSLARERAAEMAYRFVVRKGLWMNLRKAELVPDLENSINQLQELFQKKYIEEQPVYEFEALSIGGWECRCICGGVYGHGRAGSKTKAKKKASYMMLIHLLDSAGICKKEWIDAMYNSMLNEE